MVRMQFPYIVPQTKKKKKSLGPHHYIFRIFSGHELLHKEILMDTISETPANHTLTFTYTDKEDQLVTFVKFQINDVSPDL